MPTNPNKLSKFWQELKRRKVVRVITIYAAVAFVILQLVEILAPSLRLPEWTMNFILVLLIVGFIITVIVSWIYDIHPDGGIVKTEPAKKVVEDSVPPSSKGWKIASYISFVVIVTLVILNIVPRNKESEDVEIIDKSIAVLPFKNFSTEPEQDAICHGLTDEIINHLFKIESFDKVVSLGSVMTFRESNKLTPVIAEELNVSYVLEGTYKRIGDSIRVTAQLIEAGKDRHLWQKEYDRPYAYEEIMSIQSDIALQIADHLKAFLSSSVKEIIQEIPTIHQEAFELLEQANYESFSNMSFAPDTQSLDLVLKAIELDPEYADAYAAAGGYILSMANYGGGKEMLTSGWVGLHYLEKALELDPNNGHAYFGLAAFNEWFRWDYIQAEKDFLKVLELLPSNDQGETQFGEFLVKRNRMEEAGDYYIAVEDFFYNNYREIIRQILADNISGATSLLADFKASYRELGYNKWIGDLYMRLENYDSAMYYMNTAISADDPEMLSVPRHQANLALVHYRLGDTAEAQVIINELIDLSKETSAMSPGYFTGWYYSAIGEVDSALYWLEEAYQNRSPEIPWLKVDPVFNNLKNDPRYWDLYERTGHKAYDDYMASKKQ